MKKLAFVATGYIKKYDGVSVYTENLLIELLNHKDIKKNSIKTDIYIGESVLELLKSRVLSPNVKELENITFIPVNDKNFYLKILDLTRKMFIKGKYDLVLMTNLMPVLFAPGKKIKVIHDFSKRRFPELYTKFGLIYNLFLVKSAKKFDFAIGYISQTTQEDMSRYFNIDKNNKRLLFVPNGIPFKVKNFKRVDNEVAFEKFKQKDLHLCVVGRINKHKGFDRLLKFCTYFENSLKMGEKFDSVTLHIVGKQTKETENIFKNLKFKNINLIFHGFLDDNELNKIYQKSHFSFFLSRNEGYGLPLIEAMWFKSVPIISNIPIFNEIMGANFPKFDDITGYEEEIEDFINSIFDDKKTLQSTYRQMEVVIEKEMKGYNKAANNLVDFLESI